MTCPPQVVGNVNKEGNQLNYRLHPSAALVSALVFSSSSINSSAGRPFPCRLHLEALFLFLHTKDHSIFKAWGRGGGHFPTLTFPCQSIKWTVLSSAAPPGKRIKHYLLLLHVCYEPLIVDRSITNIRLLLALLVNENSVCTSFKSVNMCVNCTV